MRKTIYKSYQLDSRFAIAVTKTDVDTITKSGKCPIYRIPNQAVDYITEYEFRRTVNGKEVVAVSSFSFSEAMTAGMFEKDTYKNILKFLLVIEHLLMVLVILLPMLLWVVWKQLNLK